MPPPRQIAMFFMRVALIYGLLIAPWPGIRDCYRNIFISIANQFAHSLVPGTFSRFKPHPEKSARNDTVVEIESRRLSLRTTVGLSARQPAYVQTAFFTSLMLATPLPWSRRWISLIWGLLMVHISLLFWLASVIAYEVLLVRLESNPRADVTLGDLATTLVHQCLAGEVVVMLLIPVVVWILVCLQLKPLATSTERI